MRCAICPESLPPLDTSCESPGQCLLRFKLHSSCLGDPFIFAPVPASATKIIRLCRSLGVDSGRLAREWLSLGSRLEALGAKDIPASKWMWERAGLGDSPSSASPGDPKAAGLLGKRDFEDLGSRRERGFNLDLFDLVRTNYGLTHPSLLGVERRPRRPDRLKYADSIQTEMTDRMENIRTWLDSVTDNYNADSFSDEMRKYIRHSGDKTAPGKGRRRTSEVLVAGEKEYLQHFYLESKNMLEKCTNCQNKNLQIPKLLIETQNNSHYLRWTSNPVDIKILKKSGKVQSKRKCRLIRYVCLKCIQEKKLNQFIKKNNFCIFKVENKKSREYIGYKNYLQRESKGKDLFSQGKSSEVVFFKQLSFEECVREEVMRSLLKKKVINGKEPEAKGDFLQKRLVKKVKPAPTKQVISDNKKILSKILDDFTLSEEKEARLPRDLHFIMRPDPRTAPVPKLPPSAEPEAAPPEAKTSETTLALKSEAPPLAEKEPLRRRFKIRLNLLSGGHGFHKKGVEKQLKRWKNLFSDKQEIESKLAQYKASLTSNAEKIFGKQPNGGRGNLKKKGAERGPQASKKGGTGRAKLSKLAHSNANGPVAKVPDSKREGFESQLKEERKISQLISNKSSRPLDVDLIKARHNRILRKIDFGGDTKPVPTKMLKENGHFDWVYLEQEFFDPKFQDAAELTRIDRKLLKKTYCEFLFLNENELQNKFLKNFLADYLDKRKPKTGTPSNPFKLEDPVPAPSLPSTSNLPNSLQSLVAPTSGFSPQNSSRRQLLKHLEKFEENYLRKFKSLVQEKVRKHCRLLQKRIIFPEESVWTLNQHFPFIEGQKGNLPLNYVEDIVGPTQKNFLRLKHSVKARREKTIEDMAGRVRPHFQWIDPRILDNRIIWTGISNYLRSHGLEGDARFQPDQFQAFISLVFAPQPDTQVDWKRSCSQVADIMGWGRVRAFLKEEERMILQQKRNFILYTDFFKKVKFLLTDEHFKINKALLKDSSKLDETDCVLCFTAITCLSNPIIYCSKCERGAHRICLRLAKVPSEDFFCVSCSEEMRRKNKKKDKEPHVGLPREQKMTSWVSDSRGRKLPSGKSRAKGDFEELRVDRLLLVMKNRNFASRTEDINRILSTRFGVKFEGKLFRMSEHWAHLELPLRVLRLLVAALVKANFQPEKRHSPKLVLDLGARRLSMEKGGRGTPNQIILNPHKNYNFEDWVYSSEFCLSRPEAPSEPIKEENGLGGKSDSPQRFKLLNVSRHSSEGESDQLTSKERQEKICFSMKRGESHLVRPNYDYFPIFRCENMMILKKMLEDDTHLEACLAGDLDRMHKMNSEVSAELRRVVQVFKDCDSGVNAFMRDEAGDSFAAPLDPEQGVPRFGSDSGAAESERRGEGHPPVLKTPVFEKPKNAKAKFLLEAGKAKAPHSKDFVLQNIKMSKIVSPDGFLLDDVRQYESMMLFGHQQPEALSLRLSRRLRNEASLFVHHFEREQGLYCKKEPKPGNPFDITEDATRGGLVAKVKMKNKPLDSGPFYPAQKYRIEKRQREDHCFYCNKSDLMLVDFNSKKMHLFCLIVSGNLLDFFERPKCKLSTFVVFASLVKFNVLNFLLKDTWPADLALFRKLALARVPAEGRVLSELKAILLAHLDLRKEMMHIGLIVFKKTVVDVSCELCFEKIDSTKKGCLFRFLTRFLEQLILTISEDLEASKQALPLYSSKIQQILSSMKNQLELGAGFFESFPKLLHFQRQFLKEEFSIISCANCPDKKFHGICGYFNGNKMNLETSSCPSKFNNFLKRKNSDFGVFGQCAECSSKVYEGRVGGPNMLEVEFLRRLPVNINFIKRKVDFESFVDWKNQHRNSFTLE